MLSYHFRTNAWLKLYEYRRGWVGVFLGDPNSFSVLLGSGVISLPDDVVWYEVGKDGFSVFKNRVLMMGQHYAPLGASSSCREAT